MYQMQSWHRISIYIEISYHRCIFIGRVNGLCRKWSFQASFSFSNSLFAEMDLLVFWDGTHLFDFVVARALLVYHPYWVHTRATLPLFMSSKHATLYAKSYFKHILFIQCRKLQKGVFTKIWEVIYELQQTNSGKQPVEFSLLNVHVT